MKIKYTIHEEGVIDVPEDEDFELVIEEYKNNLHGYALAEVSERTRYFSTENITVTILS